MKLFERTFGIRSRRSLKALVARFGDLPAKHLKLFAVVALAALVLTTSSWSALLVFAATPEALLLVGVPAAVALLPAVFIAAYVWMSDPNGEKPPWLVGASFCLGALVTVFALALNTFAIGYFEGFFFGTALFFFLFVGPVEEALKILAVRVYAADTKYFGTAVDCAVFGAFAGLGFAFAENIVHLVSGGYLGSGNLLGLVVGRAGAGPLHVVLSAIGGYYLGKAKSVGGPGYDYPILLKGWLGVALFHGTYNTLISNLATPGSMVAQGGAGARVATLLALVGFFAVIGYFLDRIVRRSRSETAVDGGVDTPSPTPRPSTAD